MRNCINVWIYFYSNFLSLHDVGIRLYYFNLFSLNTSSMPLRTTKKERIKKKTKMVKK